MNSSEFGRCGSGIEGSGDLDARQSKIFKARSLRKILCIRKTVDVLRILNA